jgi:hypothetical protein
MYKILGSDGNEYDSISAEKIRQWIQEQRVDKKTPIMPEDGKDWVFLGEAPEFADAFAALQKAEAVAVPKRRRVQLAICVVLLIAVVIGFFVLKKMKHH